MFYFDPINASIAVVGLATLAFGLVVFFSKTKSRINTHFFIFVLSVFAWQFTMLMFRGFDSSTLKLLWAHLLYFSAATIPVTLLYFSYVFDDDGFIFSRLKKLVTIIPLLIISFISIYPGLLIRSIEIVNGAEDIIVFTNWLHVVYSVHINFYFLWVYYVLGNKFLKASGVTRLRIGFIILGALVSTLVGVTTNLTLPLLGNFAYNWLGQVTIIFMVTAIFYSVLRHQLFDAKIVGTEVFLFILWGAILFRTFFATEAQDQLFNASLLLGTVLIGIILIKSIIKEVRAREQLALANKQLERLNLEKSEFLSLATHQLKAPLTVMRGYASMLMEGSYGQINEKVKEVINRVFESTSNLVIIIDDFLNISRIEQGRMKYDYGPVDMKKLVTDVVTDLSYQAESAGNRLSYEIKDQGDYIISADLGKIRQVITNIVDNAIKYTNKGDVKVLLSKDKEKKTVTVSVLDSGIGMSKETLARLFRRFSRARGVGKTEKSGSGLGLYIARQMVEAHGGRIWAESEGDGRGSKFIVVLPFTHQSKESA